MYLAELTIKNFRKLREATLKFQPGLNVLVGPNNVGKVQQSMHSGRFLQVMMRIILASMVLIDTVRMRATQLVI